MTTTRPADRRHLMRALIVTLLTAMCMEVANAQDVELRGLWMTPREGMRLWSRAEIRDAMRQTADANFNTVYFLAWSRGWPMWRSRLFEREFGFVTDPAAGDRDILEEAIEEAHAAGLHIEAWMEYGFVGWWSGNGIDSLPRGPIFRRYPEWLARDSKGSEEYSSGHVGTFYWMAHSQPAVQTFLADLHAEVASQYDADGIELDRIRYPKLDCGYDAVTQDLYAAQHGGSRPPTDVTDREWMRWRADRLVDFHKLAYQRMKKANPRLVVSNAPGHYTTDDTYGSYEEYLQDWRQWLTDGSVNIVQIQMYGRPNQFEQFVRSALAPLSDTLRRLSTSGLVVKPGGNALEAGELVELVRLARAHTPMGHSFWYYNDLRDGGYFGILQREVYQRKAMVPTRPRDSSWTRVVRPGVRHRSFALEGPYTIDLLEIDLRAEGVHVETFRADSLRTTSDQIRRRSSEGAGVIAAVNGDFFSFKTHWPVGNQSSRGDFVVGLPSRRSHFGITNSGRPVLDPMSFSATLRTPKGESLKIRAVNDPLDSAGSVMYNRRWGSSTRTVGGAWEASLQPLEKPLANKLNKFVVVSASSRGNMEIKDDMWIWSSVQTPTKAVEAAETVTVDMKVWPGSSALEEIIGGGGRILREGAQVRNSEHRQEGIGIGFTAERHPRTFVGIDRDTSVLYLGTVDGRQSTSIGMNFREMARFLRSVGVWNAINLDGGGSTTMVVEGTIVNSPSDRSGERAVANTIMVVEEGRKE